MDLATTGLQFGKCGQKWMFSANFMNFELKLYETSPGEVLRTDERMDGRPDSQADIVFIELPYAAKNHIFCAFIWST